MAKKQDNLTDKIVGEAIRNLKPGQVTLESKGLVDYLCVDTDNDSESSDGSLVRGAWSWLNKRSWFPSLSPMLLPHNQSRIPHSPTPHQFSLIP